MADRRRAVPGGRFDDDEIEPERKVRQRVAARQAAALDEAVGRPMQAATLAMVDRLLGEPEGPAPSPADLDDHELRGRTRVDRHEDELMATDMDVPGEDSPAGRDQAAGDEHLGGITRLLRCRPDSIGRWAGHGADRRRRTSPGAHAVLHHACTTLRPAITRDVAGD